MKRQFIKVEIKSDRMRCDGYIDLSSVIAFRESPYDCNLTIVYTECESFAVVMKFADFCQKIGVV